MLDLCKRIERENLFDFCNYNITFQCECLKSHCDVNSLRSVDSLSFESRRKIDTQIWLYILKFNVFGIVLPFPIELMLTFDFHFMAIFGFSLHIFNEVNVQSIIWTFVMIASQKQPTKTGHSLLPCAQFYRIVIDWLS